MDCVNKVKTEYYYVSLKRLHKEVVWPVGGAGEAAVHEDALVAGAAVELHGGADLDQSEVSTGRVSANHSSPARRGTGRSRPRPRSGQWRHQARPAAAGGGSVQ